MVLRSPTSRTLPERPGLRLRKPATDAGFQCLSLRPRRAISWHFERDPIPYALETDWPVEAGGFEPLHCRIEIREDSQPGRQDSNIRISIEVCRAAPHSRRKSQAMIDSRGSDSEMQRFFHDLLVLGSKRGSFAGA